MITDTQSETVNARSLWDADSTESSVEQSHQALLMELRRRVDRAGVSDATGNLYGIRMVVLVASLGLVFTLMTAPASVWIRMLGAVMSGFLVVQFGFVGHDAGHGSISRRRLVNDACGHFGMSIVAALNFSHWRRAHAVHHRTSQREGEDPDMEFDVLFSVYDRSAEAKR